MTSRSCGGRSRARTGALFAVAQQAAAVEPLIAEFWQQGREQSRQAQAMFWTRMADDGLLDPAIDLDWLIDTAALLAAAETYLLIARMTKWDFDTYQNWLAATFVRLSAPPTGKAPHNPAANGGLLRRAGAIRRCAIPPGPRAAGLASRLRGPRFVIAGRVLAGLSTDAPPVHFRWTPAGRPQRLVWRRAPLAGAPHG